ncbi:MAG: hypothetical protein K2X47_07555, partial [Bdellovibrionales bacterium]|nr:hypothetical protein [Bdellovibrionales bacterium]
MSVSNVDRRRQSQSDEIARMREEYQEKDASQTKRHRSEVSELHKAHKNEIEDLTKAHSDTLVNQNERTREALDSKDHKYQKEMDSLKKMHVQRMKETQEKQGMETGELRRSYSAEKESTDRNHAAQVENLRRNMELQVREREARMAQSAEAARANQDEALKGQSSKMQEHHQVEKDILVANRNKDVADLQKDLTTTKETLGGQLKTTKEDHYRAMMKRDKAAMATIEDERRHFEAAGEIQRNAFKEDLKYASDQDGEGRSRIEADSIAHRKNLEESIRGRQDTEVSNLERRMQKQKVDSTIRELQINRIGQIEKKNVMNAAEERIQKMAERARAVEVDQQDTHRQDLDAVNRKNQQVSSTQFENNRREIDRIRTFEVGTYKTELEKATERENQKRFEGLVREKKINEIHNREISTNQNFFKDQLEEMKKNHAAELQEQRQAGFAERQNVTARLEKLI